MSALPGYEALAGVGREQLWGLVEEQAGPAWAAGYEHRWERGRYTWDAVGVALRLAAAGRRPAVPAARAPRFLAALTRERVEALATTWHTLGPFGEVRLLERLGLVEVEQDDSYVLAVVGGLGDRQAAKDRADVLRADPGLLPVVWRFFEVEGGGEVSLANVDKFSVGTSWKEVLGELVADGTLPRDRVLAACVDALGRDFSAYRAGWYSAFLESLSPAPAELAALQPRLRTLLGSSVTATAALAARCLKRTAAAGLLDDDACAELAPGLVGRGKGTAIEVLRLLRDVGRRRPDLVPVVAQAVAEALEHPHGDVQRAAVTLLQDLGAAAAVEDAAGSLAPTVRLLAGQGPAETAAGPIAAVLPVDLVPSWLHVPVGGELVEAVAALLEDADDPMALEAALAGLARADDPAVLAPLARRARALLKRPGFSGEHVIRAALAGQVLVAGGAADGAGMALLDLAAPLPAAPAADPVRLLQARLAHVVAVVARQARPGALLATPVDHDGWVSPDTLVERLEQAPDPHPADLAGALLRLGPQGRPDALTAARLPDDETGAAVRYALGGAPPADGTAIRSVGLWAAAARARDPLADDPLLLAAGHDAPGQGRPFRGTLEIRYRPYQYADARGTHTGRHAFFAVLAEGASSATSRYDAAQDEHRIPPGSTWARWAATVHPHDTEPVFSHLVLHVTGTLDYWEVDHTVPRALVALSRHPGRVGPLGAITAAAGLAAQEGSHRVLGVDATAALAARGTLDAPALATAMTTIAPATRLPRWATSLDQLAQAVGGGYVVDVLTALLPQLPRDDRGLVKLLDVLAEESTRARRPVSDPALREYLMSFRGGSGAAAAARRALAVT